MDFALDDTHQAVAGLARDILAREPDPDSAWKALAQAGLLAGEDLGVLETALVLGEVGRAAAPLPALGAAVGVLTVVHCGSDEQRETVAAEPSLAVALRGSVTVSAENLLSGRAIGVPHAAAAHRLLVPAGDTVFLVAPEDTTLIGTYSSAGTPEYTVVLDNTPGERVCDTERLRRFALACACAYGDGLLAGALDLTAAYIRTREQFGRPLATFQAVAQQIADVYVASRTLHLATWSAVWRLTEGRDPDSDLAVAGYWLAAEAMPALHTCHHLHGGVGVDATYAMHRYYGATKDLVRLLGGVEHLMAAV
ncbi:acyl-CoA dehydrogenase family protein [Actinophytocola oryzae]|uniref:Alkylation response protein AidB-like acyl-CoA dehydrogenase n=1 Tax=Actinophytocola oryzae TaxID=502181 RepID=A0A4R7VSC1_9PSEU|nr:acyl-CoA dehydrogenase family protein [Actinophytocola oryzae]TDV52398.1 alkylation response protein AidB-like acyl-CoA dehydrogenase [Actinophytocola oryzae]